MEITEIKVEKDGGEEDRRGGGGGGSGTVAGEDDRWMLLESQEEEEEFGPSEDKLTTFSRKRKTGSEVMTRPN